jgi:hypothetical protein
MIDELVKFYEENKRRPSQYSTDEWEKKLSNWCIGRNADKRLNRLSSEWEKIINEKIPWIWVDENFHRHNTMIDELVKFYDENKRRPNRYSTDEWGKETIFLDIRKKNG